MATALMATTAPLPARRRTAAERVERKVEAAQRAAGATASGYATRGLGLEGPRRASQRHSAGAGLSKALDAYRQAPAPSASGSLALRPKSAPGGQYSTYRLGGACVGEYTPRLLPLDPAEAGVSATKGAPLLPEASERPMERFSTGKALDDGSCRHKCGLVGQTELSFDELIGRMEATVSQAALLLNDRLRFVQRCYQLSGATLPALESSQLLEIADGIAAAAYFVQSWAHAYKVQSQPHKPARPVHCEDLDDALSSLRVAMPKLLVGASELQKAMAAAVAASSSAAEEARAAKLGVKLADLRALAPHLEHFIGRLGKLNSNLKPTRLRDVVNEKLRPTLGARPTNLVIDFLGA
eukprot:TRINITY_DN27924_c0_g1_i1.p1 TRINITY_DN27924_c0_g1~~TRINITY_DN27924_c0_g1_i1.p1  ORF type:complete len:354 (-),score=73.16 TRINITY_DN27924_c0_g1_i1:666-1727(-)